MKILFIGNFGVDYSSESHYLKTFQRLGHEVVQAQEGSNINVTALMVNITSFDIIFWVHTHGWQTPNLELLLNAAKKENIPIVGYHLDLWKGIQREVDLNTDSYWQYLDMFFTVDKKFTPDLEAKGIKAFYLPAGVFKDECKVGQKMLQYKHDIIFVGSKHYHPEWPYRRELIDWLQANYGSRFAQYGNGGLGTIRGEDLNNLYASSKIVIGDTLCKGFDYPYYLSDRIFETTGRGGFIIHPYITGIEELFNIPYPDETNSTELITEDAEIAVYPFAHWNYLKYIIDYFLDNDVEREAIRIRGMQRTLKDHTYDNRLEYIIQTVQNEKDRHI